MIQTVQGLRSPSALGVAIIHAHSGIGEEGALAELKAFARAGGQTVIDVTEESLAVDPLRLTAGTGVNLVRRPMHVRPAQAWQALRALDSMQAAGRDLRQAAVWAGGELLGDRDALCSIAVRGAWLSLETSDAEWLHPLRGLVDAGWSGQLLLFAGACHRLHQPIEDIRSAGLADETTHEILVLNPARYLVGPSRSLDSRTSGE